MTVPTDLFAEFALRTKQKISRSRRSFRARRKSTAGKERRGAFIRSVRKAWGKRTHRPLRRQPQDDLELFPTEPLETLIRKTRRVSRAVPTPRSREMVPRPHHRLEHATRRAHQPGPLCADTQIARRYYAVTCDDPGLGKPAFLAAKNAEFPVPAEVEALDYYIRHFVWGGLQRTTNETYSYAIYGIPDWKTNRDSTDPGENGQLHFWREYDYPHVIQMYFAMYRLAKNHPEIKTALTAQEYLQRAYGTANAFFTIPHEVWGCT